MTTQTPPRCTPVVGALVGALLGSACVQPEPIDMCAELAAAPASPAPAVDDGLIYQVYVRSFQDSDGDGIGDLVGLYRQLPYLADLGVRTLWLMPVFPSPGPAGYDVEAFVSVREDYGTNQDLADVIAAAEARGMRVLLDLPINHTAVSHPWFSDAVADDDSPYRDRYLFSHERWDEYRWHSAGEDDWYYGYFGADLPDLDWSNPDVSAALHDAFLGWLEVGVGGFRLDAVRQLVEADGDIADTEAGHCTLAWIAAVTGQDQDPLLLSEAWSEDLDIVLPYLGDADRPQADLATAVPRKAAIADAYARADRGPLVQLLREEQDAGVLRQMASYVGSHDISRFRNRIPRADVRRSWMVLHFLLPGSPILYYGDELDLRDTTEATGQDLAWRAPMAWNADAWGGFTTGTPWMPPTQDYLDGYNVSDQLRDRTSMLRLVRALSGLRNASPAIQQGELHLFEVEEPAVLAFSRMLDRQEVLVLVNLGEEEVTGLALPGVADRPWVDLTDGRVSWRGLDTSGIDLVPLGYRVLVTRDLAGHDVPGPDVEG